MIKKLDNPVWFSASETHRDLAVAYPNIKFYHPDYCPFGGFETGDIAADIDDYATKTDNFFIVGDQPDLSSGLTIKRELVCLQMVIHAPVTIDIKDNIVPLTAAHAPDLYALVNLVQPGYFREKTAFLGDYFGIFKNNELIAAAGERLKMNDFTEVSAIVTHPDHTRQGYAGQLTAYTANNIFNQYKTPYLHVLETNTRAIQLYEKLGFKTRRKISFWHIGK